ncbi:hypothetical protein, partial [Burkholderia multivorans]|uniref:hypothetical protein n=1 Tax=Burkholderia multivorans TaxID=87883 RepID=UPI001955387B
MRRDDDARSCTPLHFAARDAHSCSVQCTRALDARVLRVALRHRTPRLTPAQPLEREQQAR